MRVLYLDMSVRYGGASSRCINLLSHAPKGTWALAGLKDSPVIRIAAEKGIEHYVLGTKKYSPALIPRLKQVVREQGFQIIDTQNAQSKFWGGIVARQMHLPLVSTLNSWYTAEHGGSAKGRFYQFIESATAGFTSAYIAVSQDIEQKLLASRVDPEKVYQISNGVSLDSDGVVADREWLAKEFGIDPTDTICCTVGRFVHAKGYEYLVRALAQLKDRPISCLMVGDGEGRKELEWLMREEGVDNRIRIAGFQRPDDVFRIVKSSDIFVMSSVTEGMPMTLLEAAMLEKPILSTRVGGVPEMFTHEEEAILVAVGDESALAAGMVKLIEQPAEQTRKMALQAARRVNESFSLSAQFESIEALYAKLVPDRKR